MPSIKIIKKEDGYAYKYDIIKDNKRLYVTKSGFETLEEALEAAKKSYNHRINNIHPTHLNRIKHDKIAIIDKEKLKEIAITKIKNIDITEAGYKLLNVAIVGAIGITLVAGGTKLIQEVKEMFPPMPERNLTDIVPIRRSVIAPSDCDFSNLYIILRTGSYETTGVGAVTSDMLTRLGIPNEIISGDSNLTTKVSNALSNNPNSNIVLINLESGLENSSSNQTIIMGDCSNTREYPSDVLSMCIRQSLLEYDLDPTIKCGYLAEGTWRLPSTIESELASAALVNKVCQLTIDIPTTAIDDELTRNDAAASIIEGIMRWASLDVTERYRDIYYTAAYGDTEIGIATQYGVSCDYIEEYSDFNIYKGVTVGDAILVGTLPSVVSPNVTVANPYTTSDASSIEQIVNTYVVQSGDTLTGIANMYGVKPEDIIPSSGDPNNIQIGETLYITTYSLYETHERLNLTENNTQNHI